ncbi:MAG: DUF502 domain-containing protein [Gammaproteobacteria bacterium]|nr:DUF502 domain-containing protein [Gammaproteobacteria bacterium]
MKKNPGVRFILTTVIGGLLFLVPVVFLVFILGQALELMLLVAEPMAGWVPIDTIGGVALANLIALFGIVLVCFLAGLVARNALASGLVEKLESRVLTKIPGYTLVKSIKGGFEKESAQQLKPVALSLGTAERFGFEVQKLPDGRSMVFLPSVPNIWSGITQILPADQVTYLDTPSTSIMDHFERYGHGADELLARQQTKEPAPTEPNQAKQP